MDIYQLEYVLHEPQESEGYMYLAEIPALQGAMAWGETPEETLNSLLAVARDNHSTSHRGRRSTAPGGNSPAKPEGNLDRSRMTYR